jgi:phytoene synthase
MTKQSRQIFKKGSRTYYYSSLFFPKEVKDDIFDLYAFVRVADDLVDSIPPKKQEFGAFVQKYKQAMKTGEPSQDAVIDRFIALVNKHNIPPRWVDSFLASMKSDINPVEMKSLDDTLSYMYGSAEVIGLMIAKIVHLPKQSYRYARLLGRAMQYANMIRDIDEDTLLGRSYVPKSHREKFGLSGITKSDAIKNREQFEQLIRHEIAIYQKWQKESEKGFSYIPKRLLIPIKTASDMYKWFTSEIYKHPLIVFERKVKPSKMRIILTALKNAIASGKCHHV